MIYKYILLIAFFPLFVFASDDVFDISIQEDIFSDYTFNVPGGSKHNVSFIIANTSTEAQDISVRIIGDNTKSLSARTKFFVGALEDVYSEQLQNNNNDIVLFCEKKQDIPEIVKWCEGVVQVNVSLQPSETVVIPTVVDIMNGEIDHPAEIVVNKQSDEEIIGREVLTYHVPDKNISRIALQGFSLQKAFEFFDIKKWIDTGLTNQYNAKIVVQNTGTEVMNYAYCAEVQSLWIGEGVNFCNDGIIGYNDRQEYNFPITVPRFGKVQVVGSVQYVDENDQIKEQASNPIEFIVWPVQLIVLLLIFICFCGVCVLLYKYIKKNMFGYKKKKKEDDKFTGSYVVKDTDNIISIAQSYGVAWKELANINGIDPPYILISGETINVPGDEKEDVMVSDMKKKNVESLEQQQMAGVAKNNQNNVQHNNSGQLDVEKASNIASTTQDQKIQGTNTTKESQKLNKNGETQGNSKRKVTYASPENMLTKPASEPTTRAIDIEWMRDDEAVYSEEMQTQKKKMNTRFIIGALLVIIVVGLVAWWGMTWFMNSNNQDDVSINALIEDENQNEEMGEKDDVSENEDKKDSEQDNTDEIEGTHTGDKDQNESNNEDTPDSTTISPEDITVQVLNAGATVGSAGTVTDEFSQKGYKTSTAKNAQNDYDGVVIYYTADVKQGLDAVSSTIPEKYGTQKYEESNEITSKYDAGFVVVLGT